eukprot:3508056-Lingulodinium_polyedra.AAC.1
MGGLDSEFEARRLLLHKRELEDGGVGVLGVELDGRLWKTKAGPRRFWLCRQATRGLLSRRRVAGWVLEVVLGSLTFLALSSRGLLSCFHSVYAFIAQNYEKSR